VRFQNRINDGPRLALAPCAVQTHGVDVHKRVNVVLDRGRSTPSPYCAATMKAPLTMFGNAKIALAFSESVLAAGSQFMGRLLGIKFFESATRIVA
jgi:hypothetical protein